MVALAVSAKRVTPPSVDMRKPWKYSSISYTSSPTTGMVILTVVSDGPKVIAGLNPVVR